VKLGFIPALVSVFLRRRLGDREVRDLLLTGRVIDAAEAFRMGLITEVVPAETLMDRAREIAALLLAASPTAIICGYVTPAHHGAGKHVMNSAALLRHGHVEFVQSKMLLPFYDVFDEQRYFAPAHKQRLFSLGGEHVALTICEDAWNDKSFWENRLYSVDPIEELMRGGGSLVLNISASPYWRGKRETRREMLAAIARRHGKPVLMVNQVGGNDSLVFDGSSLALGRDGQVIALAASAARCRSRRPPGSGSSGSRLPPTLSAF